MTEEKKELIKGTPGEILKSASNALAKVTDPGNGLLRPMASTEDLVAAFKSYVELKDKLLEETDYTWFTVYTSGTKTTRDGYPTRKAAANALKGLRKIHANAELEKKMKKSGVQKLSMTFGVSTTILADHTDRGSGYAYYMVRASAPNGQAKERAGSCDRNEKGKGDRPFDTIEATALTRAENRATLALLGGENTAEEFEDDVPPQKGIEKKEEKPTTGSDTLNEAQKILDKAKAEAERPQTIDEKFEKAKTAKPVDERQRLLKKLWVTAGQLYAKNEASDKVHLAIQKKYHKESTKDLTDAEFAELVDAFEKFLEKKKGDAKK